MNFGEITNVIYNFTFPNEDKCLNAAAFEKEQPDFNIQNYHNFLFERLLERANQTTTTLAEKWRQRNTSTIPSRHSWAHQPSLFRLPSNNSPPTMTRSKSKSDKFMDKLKSVVGEQLYAHNLKRYAKLASKKISVPYNSSSRKDETIEWFRTNWQQVEPIIDNL